MQEKLTEHCYAGVPEFSCSSEMPQELIIARVKDIACRCLSLLLSERLCIWDHVQLPTDWGLSLSGLQVLDLSNNEFASSLPEGKKRPCLEMQYGWLTYIDSCRMPDSMRGALEVLFPANADHTIL